MRLIYSVFAALLLSVVSATAGSNYLALSFGTSIEDHDFDVWNGPATPGRRALKASARSRDYAVAFGVRDAIHIGNRPYDLEFELFERQNSDFTATGTAGNHPTAIRTTSILLSAWTAVAQGEKWTLKAGAGVGARHSVYRMEGAGISFTTTDRAPYAMVGLRLAKQAAAHTRVFTEIRAHTRPPIHSAGGQMQGPLEHNSAGITLRFGLQMDINR